MSYSGLCLRQSLSVLQTNTIGWQNIAPSPDDLGQTEAIPGTPTLGGVAIPDAIPKGVVIPDALKTHAVQFLDAILHYRMLPLGLHGCPSTATREEAWRPFLLYVPA